MENVTWDTVATAMSSDLLLGPDCWLSHRFAEVDFPVHESWIAATSEGLVYGTDSARVDVRTLRDGGLVDAAYLRRLTEHGGTSFAEQPELVRVGTRPAVRTLSVRSGATILSYVVGASPEVDAEEVRFPEIRLMYVLTGQWAAASGALKALIERSSLSSVVAAHSLDPEGHLSFGPVLIPSGWELVMSGEPPRNFLPSDDPYHKMDLSGGWLVFAEPTRNPAGTGKCVFKPQWIPSLSTNGLSEHLKARAARGRASAELLRCEVRTTTFSTSSATHYREIVRGASTQERAGFVWDDVLGYQWELYYEFTIASSDRLDRLIDLQSSPVN